MDDSPRLKHLFKEFNPAPVAAWAEKAQQDLRDTPLENLTWHTSESISLKPYFTSEDTRQLPFVGQRPGDFPFLRGRKTGNNNWLTIQQVKATGNGTAAIDKAANALTKGADGIHFILKDHQEFDVPYLVRTIDLCKHTVSYTLHDSPHLFLERLYAHLSQQKISHRNLQGFLDYDPLTQSGTLGKTELKQLTKTLELTKDSSELYGITVNGTRFSSIGASTVQEIAYTLSAAVEYIDNLTTAGETLESVLHNMQLHLASGTNYFFEVVKLRVVRLLWAAVVEAYKAEPALAAKLRLHASSSSWHQTTLDPYSNVLRATTEAMAAVLAGCDSLTVLPFDSTFKQSDEFSERIARNISIILKEEAYLHQTIDPAAGSYYLESLTHELASKAWNLFQEVEALGGFKAAYEHGFILRSITEVSRKKFSALAIGKQVLVGTNKYVNSKENINFDPEQLIQSVDFDTTRAAYPTEVMRMATELHLRKRKRRPKAIVAIIGESVQRRSGATFAQEFLRCAGFETELQPYATVEAASEKLQQAEAEVVVISCAEAAYAREFGPTFKAHKAKPIVIMADDPEHMKEDLVANGLDEFLFEDCDTATILDLLHKRLLS
ncbi:methylmalonyl-CoA mutase [Pontibacter qinzhouensis]|uniref:Methylmalonyl-CoA mutase n=1 Tax=Pontibacter qinzhouensis TaxID=2603253 RepID=A0A5C8KC57_9BACT|nr:methylmalonyl-CoA mutase family protein [Pontibacter qinzhouensis]TXK51566.1 methylmalonyl-CoA mutase [Pontibacter qinzhouensis]